MGNDSSQYWTDPRTGTRFYRTARGEWEAVRPPTPPASHGSPQLPSFSVAFPRDTQDSGRLSDQRQFTFPPLVPLVNDRPYPTPHSQLDNSAPFANQPDGFVSSSSHLRGSADPVRIPLPDDSEDDFPTISTLLDRSAKPAKKVAGSRHRDVPTTDLKGKGKARATEPPINPRKRKASGTLPAPESDTKKKGGARGRSQGVANYSPDDIEALLDILEDTLPIGGKAWNTVGDSFADWARENNRPIRTSKSLEAKFKQFVRTTKPTGDAECPPHIDRAHQIEDWINEKAGARDLDDDDIIDADDGVIVVTSDEEGPCVTSSRPIRPATSSTKATAARVKTEPAEAGPIARRASDRLGTPVARTQRAPRTGGLDLLNTIANSLDPRVQTSRDEERSARSMHTTQFLSLSNQLRDAQHTINDLRDQLLRVERDRSDAERRADRAEMQREMMQMAQGHGMQRQTVRRETRYRDGGASTVWISPSDEEDNAPYTFDDEIISQHDIPIDDNYQPHRRSRQYHPSSRRNGGSANVATMSMSGTSQSSIQTLPSQPSTSQIQVSVGPEAVQDNDLSIVISPRRRTHHDAHNEFGTEKEGTN
ncbi:hypothetical protein BV22DRAFT_1125242 [Leucogyrophana mollusca]|uniref:Uncharacterized protein n=1 Tax=Leucogyrophana mollusca TaxID=85980 RepID=A0ACB8BX90_9AGAM|nr:hypothetical protein BV22DRAFT_1125242 [Leucogyrophana mollusca]